jgi:hypothetical protein
MAIAQKDPLRLLTAVEQARRAQRSKSTSERLDRVRRAGAAGGGGRRVVRGGGRPGGLCQPGDGDGAGAALQPAGPGGAGDRGGARAAADLRPGGARPNRGDGPDAPAAPAGWHGQRVAEDRAAALAPGGLVAAEPGHDPPGAGGGGQFLSAHAHVVSHRHGLAQAPERGGAGH